MAYFYGLLLEDSSGILLEDLSRITLELENPNPPTTGPGSVGNNNFWIKGKKRFPRPKYWWEKDPEVIPEVIPLVDLLEEVEEEEKELREYIWELEYDGIADKVLTVLHAYAGILAEQAEMKRESLRIQVERKREEDEIVRFATKKRRRQKALSLLLG